MLNPKRYKDLLIVSSEGKIIYSDFSNVSFMKLKDQVLKGRDLREIFVNADENYPALRAAREGIANKQYTVEVESCTGKIFEKACCTYPIYREGKPVAALEFSDILYGRRDIREIETSSDNAWYRKNGTIYTVDDIIGKCPEMVEMKKEIESIALTDFPVLIYGRTGTGKELVAQSIHNASRRFSKPFISVNCGTIPENLAESMLFGTTRGSFTDSEDKAGFFEYAEGGTLFLDEINSLSPQMQVKLLRAVEMKVIRRIGDARERKVDVRIISATNENPKELIRRKRMLQDFYHRIATTVISLPRLADRGDDVIVLANHFINYFNRMMNMNIGPVNDEIADVFRSYSWPGNIRELRNVVEGAFAFTESDAITIDDIPMYIQQSAGSKKAGSAGFAFERSEEKLSLASQLDVLEKNLIETAVRESDSRLSDAAVKLGISKQLLNYKMNKFSRKESEQYGYQRRV